MAKHDDDNRANQMNPNNDAYYSARYGNDEYYEESCVFVESYNNNSNIILEKQIDNVISYVDSIGIIHYELENINIEKWYAIDRGYPSSFKIKNEIVHEFITIFESNGMPEHMAIFIEYNGLIDLERIIFTPSAHLIAKIFNATPCDKPSFEYLEMLAGHRNSMTFYFPDIPSL